jgi:hypothetical protein
MSTSKGKPTLIQLRAFQLCLVLSVLAALPAFSQDQNVVNPLRGNVVAISRTVAPNNSVTEVSVVLADAARGPAGQPVPRFTVSCDPAFQYSLCYDAGMWLWGCTTQENTVVEDFTGIRHDTVSCVSGVGKCAEITGWLGFDSQGFLRINLDQIVDKPASYCTPK